MQPACWHLSEKLLQGPTRKTEGTNLKCPDTPSLRLHRDAALPEHLLCKEIPKPTLPLTHSEHDLGGMRVPIFQTARSSARDAAKHQEHRESLENWAQGRDGAIVPGTCSTVAPSGPAIC